MAKAATFQAQIHWVIGHSKGCKPFFEDPAIIRFLAHCQNQYQMSDDMVQVDFHDKRKLIAALKELPKSYLRTGYITYSKPKK